MNNLSRTLMTTLFVVLVTMMVVNSFDTRGSGSGRTLNYSEFVNYYQSNQVTRVEIDGRTIYGEFRDGGSFVTHAPDDPKLVDDLLKNNVQITAQPDERPSLLMQILISWFPMILIFGVIFFLMRQMQGGGRGALSFGKSRAKMLTEDKNIVTFADVAGVDEAKEEVGELVEFLREPSRFQKLGGRIPRGVLMTGSPGTGKTLLAKAIAGEAQVPFYSISGSDFVEMFVGVGASRVRDMFEQARKNAPCIIFIDEIDAVGRKRGAGLGGGHDEREQTLNQLLVEMDGFDASESTIVIAATNRPDVLDPALLRPGRFDRQVNVPLPDIRGREAILKVHMRKVPIADDVAPGVIARGTPGFSGADLANLINEAALFAARRKRRTVVNQDFEDAKDKVIMGVERRSIVMPEQERWNTAYHESGHAVIGKSLENCDPVHKVTIIPRGRALGVTVSLPQEDRYSHNRAFLLDQIAMLLGGRIAEELFMDQMTTGASNDFERATDLAQKMVTRWGMSDELGPRVYGEDQGDVFLGRDMMSNKGISDKTSERVDAEVSRIIEEQYDRAHKILEDNSDKMKIMAQSLIDWETIDAEQVNDIMAGRPPRPPKEDDEVTTPDDDKPSGNASDGVATPDLDRPAGEAG
ncbi:ATP-dependent zinc metalloprotease FtsH [Gammaproteobacteria bacterium]|nr:ATP-dependent zinc metalloprotease FtsH [Gammaproteobacteria bacterium]